MRPLLVLIENIRFYQQGIGNGGCPVKVFPMHVNGGDAAVFVSGVIVNTLCGVAAAGIYGDFIFLVTGVYNTPGVFNTAENMEKLLHAFPLLFTGYGIELGEGTAEKPGRGTPIPGEADGSKSTAENRQVNGRCQCVMRCASV